MISPASNTNRNVALIGLAVFLASGLAPAIAAAGTIQSGEADLSITALGAYNKPVSSMNSLAKKRKESELGIPIWLSCLWEAKPKSFSKFIVNGDLQFAGSIAVNGQPFHHSTAIIRSMPDWKTSRTPGAIGPVQWIPGAAGRYSVSCNLDPLNVLHESSDSRDNNQQLETVTVWRDVLPADNLTVSFPALSSGQRFVYGTDLRVPLHVSASAPFFSLVEQGIVREPRISYEIRYHAPDREQRTFRPSSRLHTNPAGIQPGLNWFSKRKLAAGRYDVTVRIVGGRLPNIVYGPPTTATFHIDPKDMSARQSRTGETSVDPGILRPVTAVADTPAWPTPPLREVATAAAAPPSPCGVDVTYYVPQAPVIQSASGSVQSLDQISIRCDFKAVAGRIEWPTCDAEAETAIQILRLAKESGSRYSGMLTIDGQNIGVASSPMDGGDFSSSSLWSYADAGEHDVSCQIDNGLKYAASENVNRLVQTIRHDVGAAIDMRQFEALDLSALKSIAVTQVQESIAPLPDGATALLRIADTQEIDPREETILPPQDPPPDGASSVDGSEFWMHGLSIFKMDSDGKLFKSQSYQTGDSLWLQCLVFSNGANLGKPVQFRFTVDGEVVREALAPIPKEGKYTTMQTDWVPELAGKHQAACEVNFSQYYTESNYADNIAELEIVVAELPAASTRPAYTTGTVPTPTRTVTPSDPLSATALLQTAEASKLLPDLDVQFADTNLRCENDAVQLIVTGTVKNVSTVPFIPPADNTLVQATMKIGAHELYGRATLPRISAGEKRQVEVTMSEGQELPAVVVAGASYIGEFSANRMHTVSERKGAWNNSVNYSGNLVTGACP